LKLRNEGIEEADETVHWLDILIEGELAAGKECRATYAKFRRFGVSTDETIDAPRR